MLIAAALKKRLAALCKRRRGLDPGLLRQMRDERMATMAAMAARVAHEIGNPLAIISGAAQEIAASPDTPPTAKGGAALIVAQAERIGEIARQMGRLTDARPGAASVDLNTATAAALELARFDGRLAHLILSLIFAAADENGGAVRLLTGREGARLYVAVEPVAGAAGLALAGDLAAEIGAAVELQEHQSRALLWLRAEPNQGTD
jgi:signal transduction histidine kinase